MNVDIEALKQWVGRSESAVDYVTIPAVHRLGALLDRDDPMPVAGDRLPIGWHSILFPRIARQSQLGEDGHPVRGDFLPPVPLPRRMFAGKRIEFLADLRVGDEVKRRSTIKDITPKRGRSGEMIFVTVVMEISSPRGLAVREEQDIVYRGDPASGASPAPAQPVPGKPVWKRTVTPDTVMLFRYSALAFNGHRIHYDQAYATGKEGYPALVTNGGLTTLLAFELARTHAPSALLSVEARNVRPLFVNRAIEICGEPSEDGKSAKLWATDDTGALAFTMNASF
jgi:3-methylfumaryl-CoA hydratase